MPLLLLSKVPTVPASVLQLAVVNSQPVGKRFAERVACARLIGILRCDCRR